MMVMSGSTTEDNALSAESVAEWRSCEQAENGTPSTSPAYSDYDYDDDDSGTKPSDLYGKFTWKIENFLQISKRELRSNAFEIGGYKWCLLIYPQGCDASNHLSLFLCVANHENLLPGWSHFALFTIVVVNKDPRKNKYNDTLHKFCKKEHDWGWKKFMDRTKVMDGFVDDTLTIKAQVQVIREKAFRPFRCLDSQYRRELTRVHLSAVEKTCLHFFDERRQKFQTLIDDKAKWSSLCAFWLGIDQATRRQMSGDKKDDIFKITVKHFFIEKDVSSALIMDSLYNGLRVIESWSQKRKSRDNLCEYEGLPAPVIFIENDMFVLVDDFFLLLERPSLEFPHPRLSSKEEKALPAHSKDGCSGDGSSRDSIQHDDRRLTVLGLRALEISVLAHVFSKIKTAFDETVALMRQEELIREEEEAEQAQNERREKKAKKKQARQRRKNLNGKGKEKDEKSVCIRKEKNQLQEIPSDERILEDFSSQHEQAVNVELKPDIEDIGTSSRYWDTCTSEANPTAEATAEACPSEISNSPVEKKSSSFADDSSSTCSTDSIPSVVINGPYKGHSLPRNKNNRNSTNSRGKNHQNRDKRNISTLNADQILLEGHHSLKDQIQKIDQQFIGQEKVGTMSRNKTFNKDQIDEETPSKSRTKEPLSSSPSPTRNPLPVKQSTDNHTSNSRAQSESLSVKSPQNPPVPKPVAPKHCNPNSSLPRPSSISTSQKSRLFSQAQSSSSRLDSSPSLFSPALEPPKSYRNAILGIKTASTSKFIQPSSKAASSHLPSSSSSSSSQFHVNNDVGIDNSCNSAMTPDEFPHLDIINDLLDEDWSAGTPPSDGYHKNDDFPWLNKFDPPAYYYYPVPYPEFNGLQPVQQDFSVYSNGMDENLPDQWLMNAEGYGYPIPGYPACVGGYDVTYQRANGM